MKPEVKGAIGFWTLILLLGFGDWIASTAASWVTGEPVATIREIRTGD